MQSIKNLSKRTWTKIASRLDMSCASCGWNDCVCDIHHIVPQSKGGSDDHSNLTYICPNCHRKAHNNLITSFVTLEEQIGDSWKSVYNAGKKQVSLDAVRKNAAIGREVKKKIFDKVVDERRVILLNSTIDFSKYGWGVKVSKLLGISPQKSSKFVKKYFPELLT